MVSIALKQLISKLLLGDASNAEPVGDNLIGVAFLPQPNIITQLERDADFNRRFLPTKTDDLLVTFLVSKAHILQGLQYNIFVGHLGLDSRKVRHAFSIQVNFTTG